MSSIRVQNNLKYEGVIVAGQFILPGKHKDIENRLLTDWLLNGGGQRLVDGDVIELSEAGPEITFFASTQDNPAALGREHPAFQREAGDIVLEGEEPTGRSAGTGDPNVPDPLAAIFPEGDPNAPLIAPDSREEFDPADLGTGDVMVEDEEPAPRPRRKKADKS